MSDEARRAESDGEQPITVPAARLLHDWRTAHERAAAYLAALDVAEDAREPLVRAAIERALAAPWPEGSDALAETLHALRTIVATEAERGSARAGRRGPGAAEERSEQGERAPHGPPGSTEAERGSARAFLAWRLAHLAPGQPQVPAMPRLERRSMVSERVERRVLRRLFAGRPAAPAGERPLYGRPLRRLRRGLRWPRVAHRRRLLLLALVLIPTTIASGFMVNVLPYQGRTWLEVAIALFFGALFGWVSIGFWTALFGFLVLVRGGDRFAITRLGADGTPPSAEGPGPTAIVMPICEEPVERVFAGLRAIDASLDRLGARDRFHFFVLSDTADPGTAVHEEEAWLDWCRAHRGFGRVFYRRRKVRIERKSGNVADFCRRWGASYRYMIMLDADSVMAGETMVRLVELIDRHPDVGMIQTVPVAVHRRSLLARVQQFAGRVYGPMFAAGLHYWQLGDGQYWGHNTIIRVEPFMRHCGLPRLPGREPLGGEILSHDFVEAALMGRSGWSLWLAYDLGGSYEEIPSTLLEEMKRDRRWCQGNLQHLRLLFTEGLFGAHRALFLNGALSYMSALLWFTFLSLSTVEAIQNVLGERDYFPHGPSLFPEWPIWRPDWALALVAVIGMLLFFPKVLSIALIVLRRRNAVAYGGTVRLAASILLEIVLSSLLAPIRMVFHSRFVLANLLGRTVVWRSQGREDAETGWREALAHHGIDSLVASAWGAALFWLNPDYFWWVTPIVVALMLSVPVSVLTSRVRLGDAARRLGLFLIPEETAPPAELCDVQVLQRRAEERRAELPPRERDGFVRAVVDPWVNALHRVLLGAPRSLGTNVRTARAALVERALAEGPESLGARERRILLRDPALVDRLHEGVWALADRGRAACWGRPGAAPASPG